ncbi:MAG: ATP-dependent chaperone ClpB [Bdellovibrionota bacterium]
MIKPEKLTTLSQQVLAEAHSLAEQSSSAALEIAHVLKSLLSVAPVNMVLKNLNYTNKTEALADDLLSRTPKISTSQGTQNIGISHEVQRVLSKAQENSVRMGDKFIATEHLFLGILESNTFASDSLRKVGLNPSAFEMELKKVRGSQKADEASSEERYQVLEKYSKDLTALAREGKLDPVIGRDEEIRRVIQVLSRRTKNNPVLIGEPGVGKTALAEGLAQRIVAGDIPETLKNKKVLSLDLGAMIAGAKYRGEFEERLKAFIKEVQGSNSDIVLFIDELHTLVGAGKSDGAMDAGNLLKPALARGELRCIGATTLDEYKKYIEKDPALERRFQQVYVGEPSIEDTVSILRGLKEKYEIHHGVHIQDSALVAAAQLSNRYIADRFLPDKAIDLIDEAASKIRIEIDSMPTEIDEKVRALTQKEVEREALKKETDSASKRRLAEIEADITTERNTVEALKSQWEKEKHKIMSVHLIQEEIERLNKELEAAERQGSLGIAAELKYGKLPEKQKEMEEAKKELNSLQGDKRMLSEEVTANDIAGIVSKWTGIPVDRLEQGENEKLLHLEDLLRKRVRGQDQALSAVSDAVRLSRSGLKDPNKPIGVFLFLGPTGVGKTETAKTLAEVLFDTEQNMIRIDMSEYMEKHSVSRLIGAPPGYVGFEDGGQLSEAVRRRPYSVVLFDEIEKAHPDVLNALLQVFDDGRMTDGQGRNVDFRNTLLIMTSNLGAEEIRNKMLTSKDVPEYLKQHLRPEFINRIDEIVIFKTLSNELIREVVDVQVTAFNKILKDKHITLDVSDEAKDYLAELGYSPEFGARPLKRVIYRELQVPLSKKILEGLFAEGDKITAKLVKNGENKEIVFEKLALA